MSKEIKVGLLAVVAMIVLFWGYNYIKGINVLSKSINYYVDYDHVYGLQESNQVVWRGMVVGLVEEVNPSFEEKVSIQVKLNLNEDLRLPPGTKATIASDGIMGGKVIRLDFEEVCSANCLEVGSYLVPNAEGLLASFATEEEIGGYMNVIKESVGDIADSLNFGLTNGETELGLMIRDLRKTLYHLSGTASSMNQLLRASSGSFSNILSNMDSITAAAASEKESLQTSIRNIEKITQSFADAGVDSAVIAANQTLDQTTATMAELQNMLNDLNEGEGTMGKMLHDETMYNNLSDAMRELDLLLQDFRLNPKRYVNVSVFGKKQKAYDLPEADPADTAAIRE